jgi:streptogramin lyase
VAEYHAGLAAGSYPTGIAAGHEGNLWFTEPFASGGEKIGRITPAGTVTNFGAGMGSPAYPTDIAAGADGNMWFTEYTGKKIGRITPTGTINEFPVLVATNNMPIGIAAGPDGNMWYTEPFAKRIGKITPTGTVTEFTAGILGDLEYIVAGPDGNLWFAEFGNDGIGRITTAGHVTEFSAGITAASGPNGIAKGPDGNVWFTESPGNGIGRIGVDVPTMTCTVKGGTAKPKLKVVCHITMVSPSAKVKWTVKRHGLVAKNHTKLKNGKLVINLSHVAVHKGKNKVTVTTGKGTHKLAFHQTVKVHKK